MNKIKYEYIEQNYIAEFQRILKGILACYIMMLDSESKLPNSENLIRDEFLIKYLKNDSKRKQTDLVDFLFDREVPEDNTNGRTDIKVQVLRTFKTQDAYYIIECKRLDNKNTKGLSGLNAKYIENGIYRFVSKQYSTYHRVNAMIGFIVEKMDIEENIKSINVLLQQNQFKNCNTVKKIEKESFIPNFKFHYSSEHKDSDNDNLTLYHLMFDFSNNIKLE